MTIIQTEQANNDTDAAPQTRAPDALNVSGSLDDELLDRHTRLLKATSQADFVGLAIHDRDQYKLKSLQGATNIAVTSYTEFCNSVTTTDKTQTVYADGKNDEQCTHVFSSFAGVPIHGANGNCVGCLFIANHQDIRFNRDSLDSLHNAASFIEKDIDWLQQASIDRLTGLNNIKGFMRAAPQILRSCKKLGSGATLLRLHLPELRQINRSIGKEGGDLALIALANILRNNLDPIDVIARDHGCHFLALVVHSSDSSLTDKLERLQKQIRRFNRDNELCSDFINPTVTFSSCDGVNPDSFSDWLNSQPPETPLALEIDV